MNPEMTEAAESPPTEGEYRVGISFNPGGDERVATIKRLAADMIDIVLENGGDKRTAHLAATHFETGAMYAVKSITKPPR